MKKVIPLLLAMAMTFTLAACGSAAPAATPAPTEIPSTAEVVEPTATPAATETPAPTETPAAETAAPPITLVYAEAGSPDSVAGQTAAAFQKKVEELSGGTLFIDVRYDGALGSEGEVLDALLAGEDAIDLARVSVTALSGYGAQKTALLSLPFTFQDRAQFWDFTGSDLAAELLNEPQELNLPVRGLFYGEEGFRSFFTVREIGSVDDLRGMTLCVPNNPLMNELVEALGATPAAVPTDELYAALRDGTVDGAELSLSDYAANSLDEVAPFLLLDGHMLDITQVLIRDGAWNALTAEQQEILVKAGKEAQKSGAALAQEAEEAILKQLRADGRTVLEVADKAALAEACRDIVEAYAGEQSALHRQIRENSNAQ